MLGILNQVNAVPGVMGSLVCDEEGRLLSHSFPPLFDESMLEDAASRLGDCVAGLSDIDKSFSFMDFRYHDSRILVKQVSSSFLMLLCQKSVNMQYLNISLRVACKKLETAVSKLPKQQLPETDNFKPVTLAPQDTKSKSFTLVTDVLTSSGGTYWENMREYASINRSTSIQISNRYRARQFKKIKLINQSTKITKVFPVNIIADDRDNIYDGKVVLSLAALEALQLTAGETVVVELNIGGGLFGWEGI